MSIDVLMADPAGNRTAFVLTQVDPDERVHIASAILSATERFQADQVAFAVAPKNGGDGRIEMMGGEFCGNATRAYGYYLFQKQKNGGHGQCDFRIEVSGADRPLHVHADETGASAEMPLPLDVHYTVFGELGPLPIVRFQGIQHVIADNFPPSKALAGALLAKIMHRFPCDATGILFFYRNAFTPVVYTRKTGSIVWEGSCGSGSLACAVWESTDLTDGIFRYSYRQPNGRIEASVKKKDGHILACTIGGPVTLENVVSYDV